MSRLSAPLLAALMCFAIVWSVGCDLTDPDDATAIGPSPLASSGFVSRGVSVVSPSILAQRITAGVCPVDAPFIAPVTLALHAGASDLFFTGIHLQFVDQFGMRESVRTFNRTELVDRFGSLLVPAFNTRNFAFSLPFGCLGAPPGRLAIVVSATDSLRNESTMNVEVAVR